GHCPTIQCHIDRGGRSHPTYGSGTPSQAVSLPCLNAHWTNCDSRYRVLAISIGRSLRPDLRVRAAQDDYRGPEYWRSSQIPYCTGDPAAPKQRQVDDLVFAGNTRKATDLPQASGIGNLRSD